MINKVTRNLNSIHFWLSETNQIKLSEFWYHLHPNIFYGDMRSMWKGLTGSDQQRICKNICSDNPTIWSPKKGENCELHDLLHWEEVILWLWNASTCYLQVSILKSLRAESRSTTQLQICLKELLLQTIQVNDTNRFYYIITRCFHHSNLINPMNSNLHKRHITIT